MDQNRRNGLRRNGAGDDSNASIAAGLSLVNRHRCRRASEEKVPLVAAETKPLEQKAVHFPSSLQLRGAPAGPTQCAPRALTPTMTKQFDAAHVVINTNPGVWFQGMVITVPKAVRQFQSGGVLEALLDAHVEIQRTGDAGYDGPSDLIEFRRELEQAYVIAFVKRNQLRQVVGLESRR